MPDRSRFTGDRTIALAVVVLVVAVGAFWTLRAANTRGIDAIRTRIQALPAVFPVGGLKVPFDAGLSTASGAKPIGRQLLLVGSDDCPYTADVLDTWRDLIRTLPFGPEDGVTIVSIGERTVAALRDEAARRQVPIRVFLVADAMIWARSSGISGTPTTVALDREDRIRLFASREFLAADGTELFRQFFLGGL